MSFFWGSAVKEPQPEPQAQLDPMAGMTPQDRLQYMQAETRAAEVEAFRENRAFFNTAIRKEQELAGKRHKILSNEQELAEKRHKILEDGLALGNRFLGRFISGLGGEEEQDSADEEE
eukprot:scaffold20466_cov76-Amphora_coffeaeformis.AAC.1